MCMSSSKSWSFALVALQRATSVNMQSVMSWRIDFWLLEELAVSSRRWSTIALFGESSPLFILSWRKRASSGLRWGRRGFSSSVTQVRAFHLNKSLKVHQVLHPPFSWVWFRGSTRPACCSWGWSRWRWGGAAEACHCSLLGRKFGWSSLVIENQCPLISSLEFERLSWSDSK